MLPTRTRIALPGLIPALLLALALPAFSQTTPTTPVPPQTAAGGPAQPYPLKRATVAVTVLSHVSKAERRKLRHAWLLSVRQQVLVNWRPLLPNITRPPMGQAGTTVLVVSMNRHGVVQHVRVERSAGVASLDRAAEGAMKAASPLPVFPRGVKERALRLKVRFVYD